MCLIILARGHLERVEKVQGRGLINALIGSSYKTQVAVVGTVAVVATNALIAGLALASKGYGGNTQSTSAAPSTGDGAHGVRASDGDSGGHSAAGHGGGSKLHP